MRPFSLIEYENFVSSVKQNKVPVYTIKDALRENPAHGLIIRHDVDRKPKNAQAMAEMEKLYGLHSTYYFRTLGSAWNPKIIQKISSLGHEVGYHYEDLATAKGNLETAAVQFQKNLQLIRTLAPVETLAMHGSPLSKHNPLDLWKKISYRDFNITGEAFLDLNVQDWIYITDSGRRLYENKYNLRDRIPGTIPSEFKRLTELSEYIKKNKHARVVLVIHPERWSDEGLDWTLQYFKDSIFNTIKFFLHKIRS